MTSLGKAPQRPKEFGTSRPRGHYKRFKDILSGLFAGRAAHSLWRELSVAGVLDSVAGLMCRSDDVKSARIIVVSVGNEMHSHMLTVFYSLISP